MAEGIPFSDLDVRNANKVCLIGQTIKTQLFGDEDPIGQEVRLHNVGLKVIGVLSAKGANMMGQDQDDILIIPWTTVKYRINGNGGTSGSSGNAASPAPLRPRPTAACPLFPIRASAACMPPPRARRPRTTRR